MTDARTTLLAWTERGLLPRERLSDALRLVGATPNARRWRAFVAALFLWLGSALVAASLAYFIAANWQALGRYAKFALAETVIVAAVGLCVWRGLDSPWGRAALAVAALAVGALLALVGQTYQTGADTYELFAAWAVAITAWTLVARQSALWVIWLAIVNVAVAFYWTTVRSAWLLMFAPREVAWALLVVDTVALAVWEFAIGRGMRWLDARWAPRLVAVAAGTAITSIVVLAIFETRSPADRSLAGLAYLGFIGAIYWVYRVRMQELFMLAGAVLSLVVVVTAAVARLIDRHHAGTFLLLGLLVSGSAAAGAWWLRRVAREADDAEAAKAAA